MSGRAAWFEYARPGPGKLTARPVHPIGWALLLGLPLPGVLLALAAAAVAGRLVGATVAVVALVASLWLFFRLVVARGRPAPRTQA